MRYLESSLLPLAQQDNVTAVLDHDLASKLNMSNQSNKLSDSRISGKTHFGNKVFFFYLFRKINLMLI